MVKLLNQDIKLIKLFQVHCDLVFPKVDIQHAGKYSWHDYAGDDLVGVSAELIVILSELS